MNVLVACEESQEVCKAFREKGHNAFSCDVQEPSGGHPEWHILGDALEAVKGGEIVTMDGITHSAGKWDLLIAHPPCTYLSGVAGRYYSLKCTPPEKVVQRMKCREEAIVFFMQFVLADIPKIAVENPIGRINSVYRKCDQVIHPYMFSGGEADTEQFVTKATCLWLKGLPRLTATYTGTKPNNAELFGTYPNGKARTWEETRSASDGNRGKIRSKTFPGIAKAMAEQWGD